MSTKLYFQCAMMTFPIWHFKLVLLPVKVFNQDKLDFFQPCLFSSNFSAMFQDIFNYFVDYSLTLNNTIRIYKNYVRVWLQLFLFFFFLEHVGHPTLLGFSSNVPYYLSVIQRLQLEPLKTDCLPLQNCKNIFFGIHIPWEAFCLNVRGSCFICK